MEYVELGKILKYEQPTKYIVKDTKYNENYKIPVLTAGQSFILGYTNESENIFPKEKLPVIIFDDFTTAIKYVDFEFKVKSSAMKILNPIKGVNIKYVYYAMQMIKFDCDLHKRYWISQYSNIKIPLPNIEEQNMIVEELDKVSDIINIKNGQIEKLEEIIKSQFVEMFATVQKCKLSDIASIIMGQSPDSTTYNNNGQGLPFFQGKADFGDIYVNVNHYCSEPKKIAKKDDILISVRAPVGTVNITQVQCCIGRGLASIRYIEGKSTMWFLFYALKAMEQEIELKGTGSTFKAIGKEILYNLEIPMVDIKKQNMFVDIANYINKQKFKIQKSLEKMKKLQESLMSKYFNY